MYVCGQQLCGPVISTKHFENCRAGNHWAGDTRCKCWSQITTQHFTRIRGDCRNVNIFRSTSLQGLSWILRIKLLLFTITKKNIRVLNLLVQLSGRWIYSLIKVDGWSILRLLTFEGVVFIPNYSDLHGSPPFPFLWPGAAWDAHFEQTGALFRWGRGILKFFSPKFGELCSPDMETFGPFGGRKFFDGMSSIDQMKQISGIRGILQQTRNGSWKKLDPWYFGFDCHTFHLSATWCINQGWSWGRSIIKAFVQLLFCISP